MARRASSYGTRDASRVRWLNSLRLRFWIGPPAYLVVLLARGLCRDAINDAPVRSIRGVRRLNTTDGARRAGNVLMGSQIIERRAQYIAYTCPD